MTGAQALVEALEREQVTVVFGLPGVHNLPAWEALRAADGIRLVSTRHEQGAAYAADGWARATGRAGVALVTTGPGAANCVTATGEAYASGSPVVVLATDVPWRTRRTGVNRGVLHETDDQAALFAPVTKARFEVGPGDDVGEVVTTALRTAVTAPAGPVYVGIPTDLLAARREPGAATADRVAAAPAVESWLDAGAWQPEAERGAWSPDLEAGAWSGPAGSASTPRGKPTPADAAAVLRRAARPLVWAGAGAVDAADEVAMLAQLLGAPLVTTLTAAGLHATELRPAHHPAVGALWDRADLVVAIGTDFDGTDTQNWQQPAPRWQVAINVDARDAAKSWEPDLLLEGRAEVLVPELNALLEPRAPWFERPRVDVEDEHARTLLRALPHDALVVCDMCIPGYWVGGFHRPSAPRSVLYPIGWGTLGFGFPAALGAALTGRRTIAVCGDGGFLFACGELATMQQERIPLTVLLFDDKGYGMLRHDGGDPFVLHTPDFVALAQAFGVRAEQVELNALPAALDAANDGEPHVLVVEAAMRPPVTTSPRWPRSKRST